ncbi:hypothetical protein IMZ16_04425 [Cruoricaptor ignavus]|uniref:Uncharacterized protein n=1 Tax=Cruoricaptor ignavus TaxID=1118202 RepID=A0A7M1T4K2_9FLAO|nr:hypothetical protein [Cruoricaptor ignavus]QOR74681.1 hypothetical protein IMZ16_04425 [Cruoricaptor ignavus]
MKIGEKAQASPKITGLDEWIEGIIIRIRNNPFIGVEIAIKDNLGRIFFGAEKYFKAL